MVHQAHTNSIIGMRTLACLNSDSMDLSNCYQNEESDMHEYGVTIISFFGGFMALYVIAQISQYNRTTAGTGAEGRGLKFFGLLQAFFALFLIFNPNWIFGLGWFFAGVAAFGAGLSGNQHAATLAGWLNIIAFFQNVGTLNLIRWGQPILDTFVSGTCLQYYAHASVNVDRVADRCDHEEYLQALRVIVMIISITASLNIILSFAISGKKLV